MPVADLFASSRKILRQLLGRSRRAAWVAAIVPLGSIGVGSAGAAPYVNPPAALPGPVFSLRITDMERIAEDVEQDAFRFEMEVLNWTWSSAHKLLMSGNVGTSTREGEAPFIMGAGIDADGRGGPRGGSEIGPGVFDPVAIHSGQGRGDVSGELNNWHVKRKTSSFVQWDNYEGDTTAPTFIGARLPAQELVQGFPPSALVPGFGLDALGDTALDGGPGPYTPGPGYGPPSFRVNAMDGFVLDVDDWDVGEVFSVNWQLAAFSFDSAGMAYDYVIGSAGNTYYPSLYGFGVMSLARIGPSIGAPASNLPGPVFVDTAGFAQSDFSFYDMVYEIPNPAEFAAEFGGAITAPFLNPADNIFNVPINTSLIPEPVGFVLFISSAIGLNILARRSTATS